MSTPSSRYPQQKMPKRTGTQGKNVILSPVDGALCVIVAFLCVFGLMAVFSAGAPEGREIFNSPMYYFIRQLIFMIIGTYVMFCAAKFDYRKYKKHIFNISIFVIILIFATYIPGLGNESNGATRWLNTPFIQIQPSEFAKIACIFLAAAAIVDAKNIFDEKFFMKAMLIGVMLGLIFEQPNLSVTMMILFTTVAMFAAGGVSVTFLTMGALVCMPVVVWKVLGTPYQKARITGWLNPWGDPQVTGYNLIQSLYAVAAGGMFGVGFGNSKQKLFWLPFRHTDFIFSIIAEEFGLIGCLMLIGLFIALIHRGFMIASRCDDLFGKLVAFGITFSIGLQAFINIAVTTGVLPVTGVTLPLISYGGTSVVVTMGMLGILLNISRKRIKRIVDV